MSEKATGTGIARRVRSGRTTKPTAAVIENAETQQLEQARSHQRKIKESQPKQTTTKNTNPKGINKRNKPTTSKQSNKRKSQSMNITKGKKKQRQSLSSSNPESDSDNSSMNSSTNTRNKSNNSSKSAPEIPPRPSCENIDIDDPAIVLQLTFFKNNKAQYLKDQFIANAAARQEDIENFNEFEFEHLKFDSKLSDVIETITSTIEENLSTSTHTVSLDSSPSNPGIYYPVDFQSVAYVTDENHKKQAVPMNITKDWKTALQEKSFVKWDDDGKSIESLHLNLLCKIKQQKRRAAKIPIGSTISTSHGDANSQLSVGNMSDTTTREFGCGVGLIIDILHPTIKRLMPDSTVYEVKKSSSLKTITLPPPNNPRARYDFKYIYKTIKKEASLLAAYSQRNGRTLLSTTSKMYFSQSFNQKQVVEVKNTAELWEFIKKRSKRHNKDEHTNIKISFGEKQPNEEDYNAENETISESQPNSPGSLDAATGPTFSQDHFASATSPLHIKDKQSGRNQRINQTVMPIDIREFIKKCYNNPFCELYHALTHEMIPILTSHWRHWKSPENLSYNEVFLCLEDDEDSWPTLADLPSSLRDGTFQEKLGFTTDPNDNSLKPCVPETGRFPPVNDTFPKIQPSKEQVEAIAKERKRKEKQEERSNNQEFLLQLAQTLKGDKSNTDSDNQNPQTHTPGGPSIASRLHIQFLLEDTYDPNQTHAVDKHVLLDDTKLETLYDSSEVKKLRKHLFKQQEKSTQQLIINKKKEAFIQWVHNTNKQTVHSTYGIEHLKNMSTRELYQSFPIDDEKKKKVIDPITFIIKIRDVLSSEDSDDEDLLI